MIEKVKAKQRPAEVPTLRDGPRPNPEHPSGVLEREARHVSKTYDIRAIGRTRSQATKCIGDFEVEAAAIERGSQVVGLVGQRLLPNLVELERPRAPAALLATRGSAPINHELPHRPGHRPKEMRPAIPSNGVGVGGPKGLEE